MAAPFDLASGPLLRIGVFSSGVAEQVLVLVIHHIVADGWSMAVLFRELAALYNAQLRGEPLELPALPLQYADYAQWQRALLAGPELQRQLDYWRAQLEGAPPLLELPADRPRPLVQSHRGAWLEARLNAQLATGLKDLAGDNKSTLFMVLLAIFKVLLARWSGSEDVVVGTPIAGRGRTELEGLVGFFVNTLALRTRLDGNPPFSELLARVRQTALDAYAHPDLPFERLVEALRPERDLRHHPLVQVLFACSQPAARGADP